MRVTVFAPHPDDELIGCGGSLRNWALAGAELAVVYLTSGDAPTSGKSRTENAELREKEATAGARQLGVTTLEFLREPDGALADSQSLREKLVAHVRRHRPHVVYLPHAEDNHPDHIATHHIVWHALRDASGPWWPNDPNEPWQVETILGYEVWSPIARPNYVEETTDVLADQLAALARHESQLERTPYDAFVNGLNSYRGAPLGPGRYAEAFDLITALGLPQAVKP